jgi:putative peptide zinc metalloprotease protein
MSNGVTSPVSTPLCPRKSASVRIGPQEFVGGKIVHYVKDETTSKFSKFGHREAEALRLMDGTKSFEEIAAANAGSEESRLSVASIQRLYSVFRNRGLVDCSPAAPSRPIEVIYKQGPLARKLLVFNPELTLKWILLHAAWLSSPGVAIFCALTAILTEVWIFVHFSSIWDGLQHNQSHKVAVLAFGVASFLVIAAIHELAHGVVCFRYGGSVPEMGLLFRYMLIFPYAKVDDIILFKNRWHRFHVLAAGTLSSACFLPLFAIMWIASAPDSVLKALAGTMLVWFNLGVLLNLLPFIELDGYFILAHSLGLPELRKDAYRYLQERVVCLLRGQIPASHAYPPRIATLLLCYGISSLAVLTLVLVGLVAFQYAWLIRHWQAVVGFLVVIGTIEGVRRFYFRR